MPLPAMYDELAPWFHLLSAPADYDDEAASALDLLRDAVDGPIERLLELGSGGGNLASHLPTEIALTLTDLSPAMLELSSALNPAAEHIAGDMRTLRLGRTFDAVLIHDAICYLTTEEDVQAALETAWRHLRPGGAAVILPDHVRETFEPGTDHGGEDERPEGGGRGIRYLSWTTDPDPGDTSYQTDYALLLRHVDGRIEVRHDRHVEGLFATADWLRLLAAVGFTAHAVVDAWQRTVFVSRRPR
jgi:SAM-dependent methyltransferase